MQTRWKTLALTGAALAAVLGISACGEESFHADAAGHKITYAPHGVRTLVAGRAPSGARFAIVGERYAYLGQTYFGLKGTVGGAGTVSTATKPRQRSALTLLVKPGCASRHVYVLVLGLLRASRDTVIAESGGEGATVLRKVGIPLSLKAPGVLVYGVLPWMPAKVTVRAPDASMVMKTSYAELPGEHCPNDARTSSAVGAVG